VSAQGIAPLKSGFPTDTQNDGGNVVQWLCSGVMLVIEVLPSSAELLKRELESSESVGFLSDMDLQLNWNLVGLKALLGEKSISFQFQSRVSDPGIESSY
jgi:hypothetical protein